MPFTLSQRSRDNLRGVHLDLVAVVETCIEITPVDFVVTEGLRTRERQAELYASGASSTMASRHLTGHAVDVAALLNGEVRWDWPLYHKIATAMKQAAANIGVPIECGADWKQFPDGPHHQLPRKEYP